MSIRQIAFVQALPREACSLSERSVLAALAWYADDGGDRIFAGHRALATRAGCTVRWLRILLRRFEGRGWLVAGVRGRGRGHRSEYGLRLPTASSHQPRLPLAADTPAENLLKTARQSGSSTLVVALRKGDRSITKGDRSILLHRFGPRPNPVREHAVAADTPAVIRPVHPSGTTKEKEQRLRRDACTRDMADDGNYRVVLKLAHQLLADGRPPDGDAAELLKVRCAQLKIRYNGDLVARTLASASVARLVGR